MLFENINLWAVLVASVASTFIGMLWYSPVFFGKIWMKLAKPRIKRPSGISMLIGFISSFVLFYMLATVMSFVNSNGILDGISTAFWMWLGFIATVSLGVVLWEGKPFKLYILNNAYNLLSLIVAGIILAVW